MNDLQIFTYEGSPVEFELINGEVYANTTSMCKSFDKRVNDWLRLPRTGRIVKLISNQIRIPESKLIISKRGGIQAGGKTLVHKSLSAELLNWIENKPVEILERSEAGFGLMLSEFFPEKSIINQFTCFDGKYKIDYLIDSVAIEYDELHHKKPFIKEVDGLRQKEIETGYGFSFVRVKIGKELIGLRTIHEKLLIR